MYNKRCGQQNCDMHTCRSMKQNLTDASENTT